MNERNEQAASKLVATNPTAGTALNGNGAHGHGVGGNGRMESTAERGARFLTLIEPDRDELHDFARAQLKVEPGMSRLHKCHGMVEAAVRNVAEASLKEQVDYNEGSKDDLKARLREEIAERAKQKPDKGWALGE